MSFPWKNEPSPIQLNAIKRAWKLPYFAFFHAMGAGKTFTTINIAAARYLAGHAKHLVIVCPTSIKPVWGVELAKHCPCDYNFHIYESGGGPALERWQARRQENLNVVTFGVEAMSQGKAYDHALDYIKKHKHEGVIVVVDESSRIKTWKATRTKKIIKLGQQAQYRYILTGTPITQGFQDLYSQMAFLDPAIIGCKSYVLFRNMYCIQGGFENREIIGYQRTDELMEKIAPYADIVTKEQALPDLPDKIYASPIEVKPTKEQKAAMQQLHDEFMAEHAGETLTVSTVMDRLTRYQQIIGGFFPYDEENGYDVKPIGGGNPKLNALVDLCQTISDSGEKCVIWARFRPELDLITHTLRKLFGRRAVVEFHGGIDKFERPFNTEQFQNSPDVRFMVANAVVGGMGQTWTSATKTIYYSNTFSYEDRMQSEDRNHRRGTKNAVTYYDLVMNVRADSMILKALGKKHDIAEEFKDGVQGLDFGRAD